MQRLWRHIRVNQTVSLKSLYVVIEVVYHTYMKLHWIYMFIIMLIKQFSKIEEYVKYVLQIFVIFDCMHLNNQNVQLKINLHFFKVYRIWWDTRCLLINTVYYLITAIPFKNSFKSYLSLLYLTGIPFIAQLYFFKDSKQCVFSNKDRLTSIISLTIAIIYASR
jgi:hypothetical protein